MAKIDPEEIQSSRNTGGDYDLDVWWTPDCGHLHLARNPVSVSMACPDGGPPEGAYRMSDILLSEGIRSKAWAAAKPAALDAWLSGSADTTGMLVAASRGLDAALAEVLAGSPEFHALHCLCRDCENAGCNGWARLHEPRRARRAGGGS